MMECIWCQKVLTDADEYNVTEHGAIHEFCYWDFYYSGCVSPSELEEEEKVKKDYKWLEGIMKKHGISLYDVTCFIYEYMMLDLEHMYVNGEVDPDVEKLYKSVIDDIKLFVVGREK